MLKIEIKLQKIDHSQKLREDHNFIITLQYFIY